MTDRQPMDRQLTWIELVALEPRLAALENIVRAVEDDGTGDHFCANAVWFGYEGRASLKGLMCRLVGYTGLPETDPWLRTSTAYAVAYDHLYNLLPECRGSCGCVWVEYGT